FEALLLILSKLRTWGLITLGNRNRPTGLHSELYSMQQAEPDIFIWTPVE
ncbi:3400_t:CDS:1, partial [Scutellospora calospora]